MNILNLKQAFNYLLENVKPEEFSMRDYLVETKGGFLLGLPLTHPCNTVGCVIGKCAEHFYTPKPDESESYGFIEWSEEFFGISWGGCPYDFLFESAWDNRPETATLEQALLRLKFVITYGLEPAGYTYFGYAYVMDSVPLTPYVL